MPSSAPEDPWENILRGLTEHEANRAAEHSPSAKPDQTRTAGEQIYEGFLALKRNLITAEQFQQALRDQQDDRTRGIERKVGQILVDRGWITQDALARLLDEERRPADRFPVISRFEINRCLGEGASAVVYAAWDREIRRPVALKVLRSAATMSAVAQERFRREATAAGGIVHPNVVTVYDSGEENGQLFLVMELVAGQSLAEIGIKEGKLSQEKALRLLAKAARGVAAAHEKGIVHRDLKPANILVTPSGEPKVSDFGLAHLGGDRTELTRTGATLGTPLYMSSEQVEGRSKDVTPRTDVYALGAILYEILTGRPPHVGEVAMELYRSIVHDPPISPRRIRAEVAPELEAIVLKALDKDPARRYPTAGEFAEDLDRFLAGEPVKAKSPGITYRVRYRLKRHRSALATGLVLIAAIGFWFYALARIRSQVPESVRRAIWISAAHPSAEFRLPMAKGKLYSEGSLSGLLVFADVDNRSIPPGDAALLPDRDEGGWVSYQVDIPLEAEWFLWARLYYPGGGVIFRGAGGNEDDANSFFVSVDRGKEQVLGNLSTDPQNRQSYFRRWHWDGNSESSSPQKPRALALGRLSPGAHQLRVRNREALETATLHLSPRLDMLCLTTDGAYVPRDEDVRR